MRLTTFTDYSLRLLLYLAVAPERRATIAEVAQAYCVSEHHMVKVVHVLGKAGVLSNTRGRHGGVALAQPPVKINIGRVVRLTEGPGRVAECFDARSNECRISGSCRLRRALGEAVDGFYNVLDKYTLQDLALAPAVLAKLA